jgi:hypothetical protein
MNKARGYNHVFANLGKTMPNDFLQHISGLTSDFMLQYSYYTALIDLHQQKFYNMGNT